MASGTYKNFIRLLDNWPLDKTKASEDLGQHIRKEISKAFSKGESNATIDRAKCDRYYASLQRISSNYYKEKYKRTLSSTASGLSASQCRALLSTDLQNYFKEEEKGFVNRLINAKKYHNVAVKAADILKKYHSSDKKQPTMWNEISRLLQPEPKIVVDMTFGSGGHSRKILESFPGSKIFALDRDPVAFEEAQNLAEKNPGRVVPLLGKFSDLPELLAKNEVAAKSVDLFLFEFGPSEMQLENETRGFSPLGSGLLDMRMNGTREPLDPTAADVLEAVDEMDLTRILRIYGNEKRAREIAKAIIETRSNFRITTTKELVQLLESFMGSFSVDRETVHYHAAYKTFQALRMFVNNELNEINHAILLAQIYLKERGQLVAISQTKLEDMIVKQHLTGRINDNPDNRLQLKYSNCDKTYPDEILQEIVTPQWRMAHKHVIMPEKTVEVNATSLRLRVMDKCA